MVVCCLCKDLYMYPYSLYRLYLTHSELLKFMRPKLTGKERSSARIYYLSTPLTSCLSVSQVGGHNLAWPERRALPSLASFKDALEHLLEDAAWGLPHAAHATNQSVSQSVSSRSRPALTTPPSQRTAPLPSVNTSTEYSLARATQFR